MTIVAIATISRNAITIPKDVVSDMKLTSGDKILFCKKDGEYKIRKLEKITS